MELANGVYHFSTSPFNWYLIEDGGRLTLVDAGFPGHYREFVAGIQSTGFQISDVEAILLTHAHADHMGFAERLRKEANATVYVHQADQAATGRRYQLPWTGLLSNAWRPFVASLLGHATRNGVFTLPPIKDSTAFNDGDVLDVPGKPQVMHVPGHTPGEVAFYLPKRDVLFSGDTLVTQCLMSGQSTVPAVPASSLNQDTKLAARALDCLRELGNVTMLPGHGKPWTGCMKDAVEEAKRTTSG